MFLAWMDLSNYLCRQDAGVPIGPMQCVSIGQLLSATDINYAYFLKLNIWNKF